MGLEREGLRVAKQGGIAQTPHPSAFGCALTHPNITTDFSESLIELVTPPLSGAAQMLGFLENTQHYLYQHLPEDQNFWAASMPCVIRGQTYIPIAQYGASNQGKMKTVYRQGLANRYGSVMQVISGIHFNYSFAPEFWQKYHARTRPEQDLRAFIDTNYMGLMRNVLRYGWVIPYLFGASGSVCKSFLKGYHDHSLVEFNHSTLFKPYATSLRMGDIGYQNLREGEAGVKANYNSLSEYIDALKIGIQTPCAQYEAIGLMKNEHYQQLNTHILQIENEYYASARPKPRADSAQKPLDALASEGIDYIELRSIDVNPLLPLGIDTPQVHFLEAFLMFCLLNPSPKITEEEQLEIDKNDQLVAHSGRLPELKLTHNNTAQTLTHWGREIANNIAQVAQLFGAEHQTDVVRICQRFERADLTPSALMLEEMGQQNQGFFEYVNARSTHYKAQFLARPKDVAHFAYLDAQTRISCTEQRAIERADCVSFEQFLAQYFNDEA